MTPTDSEQKILKVLLGGDGLSKTELMRKTNLSYYWIRQKVASFESRKLVKVEKANDREDRVLLTRKVEKWRSSSRSNSLLT